MDWLKKEVIASISSNKQGPDLNVTDPSFNANLRALAELAKTKLSVDENVTLRIPGAGPLAEGKREPLLVDLSRDKFEELSTELWQRCRLPLDQVGKLCSFLLHAYLIRLIALQACWNAGVDLDEVVGQLEERRKDLVNRGVPSWKAATLQPQIRPKSRGELSTVILVGGATRMPAVSKFIQNMTGLTPLGYDDGFEPSTKSRDASLPIRGQKTRPGGRMKSAVKRDGGLRGVNPDEAVALGAAVQAGVLQGQIKGLMVMDQWQASLMRALADMKLKSDPAAKERLTAQFELEEEGREEALLEGEGEEAEKEAASSTKPKKAINRTERRRREREG